ncbi:dihydrolipoamide acetyltransferase family protein [Kyrpidia spormannii]|uniref:Pyruvate dehydrogenase (Dihydrolipoamide acetyltransferase E2 subunit) n=1 Tax=Kyrpidia spormannii TaxID=2055160 RepID=A0ACA8Z749_9BACL|nr:dihydrolipoamide acetyltransferase family protein [Kyrpidia spormannii]CAB3390889.1 pyruvate dehydrogenase (dihydrolipoamide acetyltransferase E2 subunit) [Kyrpidia spormannii]
MIYQWRLPDVGEGIHEAEIVRWRVQPGEVVTADQVLLEVQTDKATVEIPSPVAGKVVEVHGDEGQVVPVGTVLVEIETEEGQVPGLRGVAAANGMAAASATSGVVGRESERRVPPGSPGTGNGFQRAKAAPVVRRLARELGIDINQVPGTGPGGRVLEEDVRAFAARGGDRDLGVGTPGPEVQVGEGSPETGAQTLSTAELKGQEAVSPVGAREAEGSFAPGQDADEQRIPLRGVRRVIAEHMVRSKFTIPHVTGMDEADVTELVAFRRQVEESAAEGQVKITYLPFIVKAVVAGLKAYPYFNAVLDDERREIVVKRRYHIGIAVDAPDGLLVPVVHDADRKSVLEIAEEIEELKEKARSGSLSPDEMRGGTFTISNIGSFGGLFATPIIHYPQAAILATGKIVRRPVMLEDERVVGRWMMPISLTFDHRIIDGAAATRFMGYIMQLLGNPMQLMVRI